MSFEALGLKTTRSPITRLDSQATGVDTPRLRSLFFPAMRLLLLLATLSASASGCHMSGAFAPRSRATFPPATIFAVVDVRGHGKAPEPVSVDTRTRSAAGEPAFSIDTRGARAAGAEPIVIDTRDRAPR